jgi:general transcriptional corepressor CYC8
MSDPDGAIMCYEQALKHNPWSIPAMQGIACILRTRDRFPEAVDFLKTILKADPSNGEVWGSLGRLMA